MIELNKGEKIENNERRKGLNGKKIERKNERKKLVQEVKEKKKGI